MLIWLVARPTEGTLTEGIFPFVLISWRAAVIGMKYAYFAPSDLQELRSSTGWTKSKQNVRLLGMHIYFNVTGTLASDHLEHLCKAAAKIGMLEDLKGCSLEMSPEEAAEVWFRVKMRMNS